MRVSVLKPGLLVSLKTSVWGGVSYRRVDLEAAHETQDGAQVARWETTREIPDPAEFEAATAARNKARALVSGVCCASSFGLLCPVEREADLEAAIIEARKLADAHNAGAALSRVEVYVLAGRVAVDDVEAARAVASEVRGLLADMEAGIRAAAPERIREAANRARSVAGMLSDETAGKVQEAIKEARQAARQLVKRVEKAGEAAAVVVAELNVQAIQAARFAFLDLEAEAQAEGIAPTVAALDLMPEAAPAAQAAPVSAPAFELEG